MSKKSIIPKFNIQIEEQFYIQISITNTIYTTNNNYFSATQINQHLFLGDKNDASNIEALHSHNIKHIVNMANDCEIELDDDDITVVKYGVNDDPDENITEATANATQYISDCIGKKENVMVVCRVGVSRSASVVIAFLIQYENMAYQDAFDVVKSKRPIISPNFGFCNFLRQISEERKNKLIQSP